MGNDEEISEDCKALRLVRSDWIKDNDKPSSIAFQDRRESGAMSIFLEDDILNDGESVENLLALWPNYRICYLTVGELRSEFKQEIERKNIDEFPGHALVRDLSGKRSQGTRSRMAQKARWYYQPD